MIFEDIIVPLPAKKRVTKPKTGHTKPYVYEVLKRKGKDSPNDVVMCVGVAISDTEMHPNEKYYDLHPEAKKAEPKEESIMFDDQIHLGSSMLMRAAAKKTGLTRVLKECFPGYEELIQSLAEYYMLERDSTAQLFKYYLYDHYTELNYIPSDSSLSRFFNDYMSHARIKKFLESWMKTRLEGKKNITVDIDFDSTNFNIGSGTVESAEHGKAKVDEGLPQVNVAYFLERSSGLPVYYDIYYGSIIDMEHCKTAVNKVKTVSPDLNASFVMDRGYFSSSNLNYLEENGFNYLCMGKSTSIFNELISVYPSFRIAKAENRVYGTIYGVKEKRRVFKESSREYYIYFYYDSSKAPTEVPLMQDRSEYACEYLLGKKDKNGHILQTFSNLVDMTFDDNKVITSVTPNYKALDNFRDKCGYFWIISNEDMSVDEAILAYRHRDSVEKTFKGIKSGCDLNKVYSQSDAAFEAKSLLAFVTSILRAELTMSLRPYFIQYSSETSQTVLKELEKIKAENFDGKFHLRYALTSRQKQILSFYDMNVASVQDCIMSMNNTLSLAEK